MVQQTTRRASKPSQKPQPEPEPGIEDEDVQEETVEEVADSFASTGDYAKADQDWESEDLELNLEDVEETTWTLLPVGIHDGRIDEAEYGLSNSGNPMITLRVKFPISDNEDGDETTLRYYLLLAPKHLGRTKKIIRQIAPDLDLTHFRPNDADSYFSGRDVSAKVKIKPFDGERRNNITQLMAPRGPQDEFLRG